MVIPCALLSQVHLLEEMRMILEKKSVEGGTFCLFSSVCSSGHISKANINLHI